MLTFTQRKEQAAKLCGIHYTEPEMAIIISNLKIIRTYMVLLYKQIQELFKILGLLDLEQ